MNLNYYQVDLPLQHTFTISRESRGSQASVLVELEHEGITGLGEVTENSFYGHSCGSIIASLRKAEPHLDRYIHQRPEQVWEWMKQCLDGDLFALSAIDMAAHDWHGKYLKTPTWQAWGLAWDSRVPSSYTIGIDDLEVMIAKLRERPQWPIYKIKLGTSNDVEIVEKLRRETEAEFRVDANCGWTVGQAIANSQALVDLGVQFIEQPLPIEASVDDKKQLLAESALPIIADEDCQVAADVAKCHGCYHGINIKICKCGGLSPALMMLREAKELGMQTMIGCMIESSIGISGAAQLLPLLDYADLDGAILLKDEPASGVTITNGQVMRPTAPGCGASIDFDRLTDFQPAN